VFDLVHERWARRMPRLSKAEDAGSVAALAGYRPYAAT
jgi:hypothetical protein